MGGFFYSGDRMPERDEHAAAVWALKAALDERHDENVVRIEATDEKIDEMRRDLAELKRAFPNEDPDSHRRYHEALIRGAEARSKLWQDLLGHLLKNGIWAGVIGMIFIVGQYIKTKLTGAS